MRTFIATLLLIVSFSFAKAQSINWEGEIHFTTTYTYFPPELESYKPYMPVSMDFYIRKNLVCKEGPTGFANGYQIHIQNLITNSGYTAMRVSDNSIAFRKMPKDFQSDLDIMPNPISIEYIEETRTIAGFVCKKALVFLPTSTKPFVVYYTTQIPAEAFIVYKGLKGFPLYFEANRKGVLHFSEAQSIHPTKQPDSRFLLPKEYRVLPIDEFKQSLMEDLK